MDGVTMALALFILLGAAYPSLIKNKPQYYSALAGVLLIIFLDAIGHIVHSEAFDAVLYFFCAVVQMGALVLLVLSAGGMTVGEFRTEIEETIDTFRHGETRSDVIVPLSGQTPRGDPPDAPPKTPGSAG
jgi:hypothetical protein